MFGIGLAPDRNALPPARVKMIGQPITFDASYLTFDSTVVTLDETTYTRAMLFPNEATP